jgi:hypothetical protein
VVEFASLNEGSGAVTTDVRAANVQLALPIAKTGCRSNRRRLSWPRTIDRSQRCRCSPRDAGAGARRRACASSRRPRPPDPCPRGAIVADEGRSSLFLMRQKTEIASNIRCTIGRCLMTLETRLKNAAWAEGRRGRSRRSGRSDDVQKLLHI